MYYILYVFVYYIPIYIHTCGEYKRNVYESKTSACITSKCCYIFMNSSPCHFTYSCSAILHLWLLLCKNNNAIES